MKGISYLLESGDSTTCSDSDCPGPCVDTTGTQVVVGGGDIDVSVHTKVITPCSFNDVVLDAIQDTPADSGHIVGEAYLRAIAVAKTETAIIHSDDTAFKLPESIVVSVEIDVDGLLCEGSQVSAGSKGLIVGGDACDSISLVVCAILKVVCPRIRLLRLQQVVLRVFVGSRVSSVTAPRGHVGPNIISAVHDLLRGQDGQAIASNCQADSVISVVAMAY